MSGVADWTVGAHSLAYQSCPTCRAVWYFHRGFCPDCGNDAPIAEQASGRGVVYAKTVVSRAPTPELRSLAPYAILLVDAEEGFRVMAHGDADLAIGDAATAQFKQLGDRLIPYFSRA